MGTGHEPTHCGVSPQGVPGAQRELQTHPRGGADGHGGGSGRPCPGPARQNGDRQRQDSHGDPDGNEAQRHPGARLYRLKDQAQCSEDRGTDGEDRGRGVGRPAARGQQQDQGDHSGCCIGHE